MFCALCFAASLVPTVGALTSKATWTMSSTQGTLVVLCFRFQAQGTESALGTGPRQRA